MYSEGEEPEESDRLQRKVRGVNDSACQPGSPGDGMGSLGHVERLEEESSQGTFACVTKEEEEEL